MHLLNWGEKNSYRVIQISSYASAIACVSNIPLSAASLSRSPLVESVEFWIKDSRGVSMSNVTYPQDASYISADPSCISRDMLSLSLSLSLSVYIPYSCRS